MNPYRHIVQYYETDKMGIAHHSNYIRWMEEARVNFLSRIGWDFAKLERMGIASPVVDISCRYSKSTTFSDEVLIDIRVQEFKGVRLILRYVMKNKDGDTVAEATSTHCFLDQDGKLIRVARQYPEFYEALMTMTAE